MVLAGRTSCVPLSLPKEKVQGLWRFSNTAARTSWVRRQRLGKCFQWYSGRSGRFPPTSIRSTSQTLHRIWKGSLDLGNHLLAEGKWREGGSYQNVFASSKLMNIFVVLKGGGWESYCSFLTTAVGLTLTPTSLCSSTSHQTSKQRSNLPYLPAPAREIYAGFFLVGCGPIKLPHIPSSH